MKKTIAIHILGYRAVQHLKDGALIQMQEAAKNVKDYNLVIVFQDNYSQDGSIEIALDTMGIDVLLSTHNLMYTGGVNCGLQYIERCYHPDYVILADADNYSSPALYTNLIEYMEQHPDVGMAQPLIVTKTNPSTIYSCGHQFVDGLYCRPIRVLPNNLDLLNDLESCSICSSIIRMDVLRKIGLLNDCYKIYYESSDLSFRIRRAGYVCACCLDAAAYNDGTIATRTGNYHEAYYRMRNGLLFWYIHDINKFTHMQADCLAQLELLNQDYRQNVFCTDCVLESTRKGIEDGLEMCRIYTPIELSKMAPSLDSFDKSKVIVLRQGDKLNGS